MDLARQLSLIDGQVAGMLAFGDGELAVAAPRVSAWSVGQQLDHLSRVGIQVATALVMAVENGSFGDKETSLPIKLVGRAVLGAGWLPRGIAQAPKSAMPETVSEREEIRARLRGMREEIRRLEPRRADLLAVRSRMKHPRLGGLNPEEWVRFLFVHQHHHLKIVRDIFRAAKG